MILNQKGIGWDTILEIVMVGAILVVLLWIFRPTASEAGMFFSSQTLEIKDKECLLEGQKVKEFADRDGDKRPDWCDVCPDGNNNDDNDGDRMPNHCDEKPNDRTSVACRFKTTNDGRCVEDIVS